MTDELPSEIQAIADRITGDWGETIDVGPGWFQADLGISRKVLTERLSHLVDHGVLERASVRPATAL